MSNHPPHIYIDDTFYFISAHTFRHQPLLKTDQHKQIFWNVLSDKIKIFSVKLDGWIINADHYHLLIRLIEGHSLVYFIKELHGKSSYLLNIFDSINSRNVWDNYWDRCLHSEKDYYIRLNYIHHNSVKHGYTKNMEDYKWSSFNMYLEKYGKDWLDDCFIKYPVKDFTLELPD